MSYHRSKEMTAIGRERCLCLTKYREEKLSLRRICIPEIREDLASPRALQIWRSAHNCRDTGLEALGMVINDMNLMFDEKSKLLMRHEAAMSNLRAENDRLREELDTLRVSVAELQSKLEVATNNNSS
ncbi:hypothetical protein PENSPDRAFT_665652 [Peniophora sp. CONT]|nr:hypothetical protein PENSPDRAFT_665652 [Peniophora sp. CONT]